MVTIEWAVPDEIRRREAKPQEPPKSKLWHHDEYADVVPIPFFPVDLPTLEMNPLEPQVMQDIARLARRWLWLQPPTQDELLAA